MEDLLERDQDNGDLYYGLGTAYLPTAAAKDHPEVPRDGPDG